MFIDYLLLDRVAYGLQIGPGFHTNEKALRNGHDIRNALWSRPKMRITAPFRGLNQANAEIVRDVFNVCQGKAHSFRYFDRFDYALNAEVIGTADGSTDQELQLIKSYTVYGITTERIITKPVDSTRDYGRGEKQLGPAPAFQLYADGAPISSSVDYLTGLVTFTASAAEVITASCWFDVPMRFESDELFITRSNRDAHDLSANLIEDWAA